MDTFNKLLAGLSALIATLVGILLVWDLLEPYVLNEDAHDAMLPNLAPAWECSVTSQ